MAVRGGWLRVLAVGGVLVGPLACGGKSRDGASGSPTDGGEGQQPTSGAVSTPNGGSRLEARVLEAESGAVRFLGWHDTMLDANCAFEELPSGELACLPSGDDRAWTSDDPATIGYADPGCSKTARQLSITGCASPRFAQLSSASNDPCQPKLSFVKVIRRVESLYRWVGQECLPVALPEPTALSPGFFEVEPFELAGFASATLRAGAAADGIRPVYLRTSDGAEAFWSFQDATEGFDCELRAIPDAGGLRCIPSKAPGLTGFAFADEGCLSPAALTTKCSKGASALYLLDTNPDAQGNAKLLVREGGARLSKSFLGSPASGTCSELHSQWDAFEVGATVPNSRFVAGAIDETADARGLIAPIEYAGGWSFRGGKNVRNENFGGYDCVPLPTLDGVVRCVPRPTFFQIEYADAACSVKLIQDDWDDVTAISFATRCPAEVSVFERGEQYSGPVYRKEGEACIFDHEQPATSRTIYYRLEGELPPESFPALSIKLY